MLLSAEYNVWSKNSYVEIINSIILLKKIQEIFNLADVQLTKASSINFKKRKVECSLNCYCALKLIIG